MCPLRSDIQDLPLFFLVINPTFNPCRIKLIEFFFFQGCLASIYFFLFLSSSRHPFCCFRIDLGPVIVRAPSVVICRAQTCFAGFNVLYHFHCSIDRVDAYLMGKGGRRCQSMGQTLAADHPVRRAGSKIAQQSSVIIWRKSLFNEI